MKKVKHLLSHLTLPNNYDELVQLLRRTEQKNVIDADALSMMESVMQVSQLQARDVMVPRSQMVTIKQEEPLTEILKKVTESGHSRFPVEGDDQEEIIGILLAKDLLDRKVDDFDLEDIIRPAVFVPESKRLNTLLKEFRDKHNHLAIVADEYGGVAGLITIEDVIEQIVGEIEDEHDLEETAYIKKHNSHQYIIKGITPIEEFNEQFHTTFSDEEFDTIGGLIVKKLGHLPRRNEKVKLGKFEFTILRADKRRVHLLSMVAH